MALLSSDTTPFLTSLTDSELVLIKGPDAAKFLQGQVTCDVRELLPHEADAPLPRQGISRLGAQCNPKGRILLTFRALQLNAETIILRVPQSMQEAALKTLGKYIVFSKAKLHSGAADFALFGLYGEGAAALATQVFGQLPPQYDGWLEKDGNLLIQLDENRFECWISHAQRQGFVESMATQTQPASLNDWHLLNIAAGVAEVYPETLELFTPQELNYQLINGVSFRKGCYTGQEIVARLHYRGKLKRHCYHCEYPNNSIPAAGTTILHAQSGQVVGAVVMATANAQGRVELLASVLSEHIHDAVVEGCAEKLSLLELPYAIPTADDVTP